MNWLENEYRKCVKFCETYKEYQKIRYLRKYEPKLKNKETQLKYQLLGILEHIIEE